MITLDEMFAPIKAVESSTASKSDIADSNDGYVCEYVCEYNGDSRVKVLAKHFPKLGDELPCEQTGIFYKLKQYLAVSPCGRWLYYNAVRVDNYGYEQIEYEVPRNPSLWDKLWPRMFHKHQAEVNERNLQRYHDALAEGRCVEHPRMYLYDYIA